MNDPNKLDNLDCVMGQVVSLRSGGPSMTVAAVEGDKLLCVWFDKSGRQKSMSFERAMLQKGDGRRVMLLPACPDCEYYAPADIRLAREQTKEQVN